MDDGNLGESAASGNELLATAERIARMISDGHVTIMRFTTNYRVSFSTPTDREDIDAMAVGATLEEALRNAIEAECGRAIFPSVSRVARRLSAGYAVRIE